MHTNLIHAKSLFATCIVTLMLCVGMCAIPRIAFAESSFEFITANPENSFDFHVTGQYFPADSQKVVEYINKERKEACDKHYFGYRAEDYKPLTWNQGLETLARERAAESSIYPIHSRTSGENPKVSTWGENLAFYSTDTLANTQLLMSEKKYYLQHKNTIFKNMSNVPSAEMQKIGHYYNFVDPAWKYVGAATYRIDATSGITPQIMINPNEPDRDLESLNNYGVTAITFSSRSNYGENTEPLADPPAHSQDTSIYVSSASFLEMRGSSIQWPDETLQTGHAYQINAKATLRYNDKGQIFASVAPIRNVEWQTSDPNIATVDRNGVITALKPGSVTISLNVKWAPKLSAKKTFTITGDPTESVNGDVIKPTSNWQFYNDATAKAIDMAQTEERVDTSQGVTMAMVKLRKKVDKLPHLDYELKANFKELINQRAYNNSIPTDDEKISAMEKDYAFATYADECIAQLNAMSNLSNEDRTASLNKLKEIFEKVRFGNSIDLNTLSTQINDVKKEAEIISSQNIERKQLEENIANLRSEIQNSSLPAEKKSELITQLESVNTPESLNAVKNAFDQAKTDQSNETTQEQRLAEAKAQANQDIDALQNISSQDKATYKDRVAQANSIDDIDAIYSEAQQKDQEIADQKAQAEALSAHKAQTKTNIAALNDLSSDEIAQYSARVDSAQNIQEVDNIYQEAQNIAAENRDAKAALASAKEHATQTLASYESLTDEQRQSFSERIAQATTTDEVSQALEAASTQNAENKRAQEEAQREEEKRREEQAQREEQQRQEQQRRELEAARTSARSSLETLTYLSEDQKSAYLKQIDDALTSDALRSISEAASTQNAENKRAQEEAQREEEKRREEQAQREEQQRQGQQREEQQRQEQQRQEQQQNNNRIPDSTDNATNDGDQKALMGGMTANDAIEANKPKDASEGQTTTDTQAKQKDFSVKDSNNATSNEEKDDISTAADSKDFPVYPVLLMGLLIILVVAGILIYRAKTRNENSNDK